MIEAQLMFIILFWFGKFKESFINMAKKDLEIGSIHRRRKKDIDWQHKNLYYSKVRDKWIETANSNYTYCEWQSKRSATLTKERGRDEDKYVYIYSKNKVQCWRSCQLSFIQVYSLVKHFLLVWLLKANPQERNNAWRSNVTTHTSTHTVQLGNGKVQNSHEKIY